MRRPTSRLTALLVVPLLLGVLACSSDGDGGTDGSDGTTTTASAAPATTIPDDPSLVPLLVQPAELPDGFEEAAPDVDTVTTFCVGTDAASGLRGSGRALAVYVREVEPFGQSIVHIVLRLDGDGAATFVQQAQDAFEQCHEIPDLSGLAYSYSPAPPELEALFAGTDGHVVRHGSSVGSGSLQEDVAVFRNGDVAHLVAVLANDRPPPELEALARTVFAAAVAGPSEG